MPSKVFVVAQNILSDLLVVCPREFQIQTDFEFHAMIYDWSGNETITTTMNNNWHHIRRAMSVVVRQGLSAEKCWQEHQEIIDALKVRDAQALIRAQSNHGEHAVQALTTRVAQRKVTVGGVSPHLDLFPVEGSAGRNH